MWRADEGSNDEEVIAGERSRHELDQLLDPPPFSADDEVCLRCRRSRTFRIVGYRVALTSYGWRSTIELRCAKHHRRFVCSSRWLRHVPAGPWWWRLAVVVNRINIHLRRYVNLYRRALGGR